MSRPVIKGRAGRSKAAGEEANARRAVLDTALEMCERGLSPGRSGNVSQRFADGMLITPSAKDYRNLALDEIVRVDGEGGAQAGFEPSSEWRFHLAVYRARPDVGGVVHAHSMHATVLACAQRPIPAFHYMVATAGGGDIPIVPYALFGSAALARHVTGGLHKRDACLMANHGQIAVGPTLASALALAFEVETLAEQYYKVLTLGGPHLLSAAQMEEAIERFKSYGRKAPGA